MATQISHSENIEERLCKFLENYAGDRMGTKLLAFWGRHPDTGFTKSAICWALDCKKHDINRALKDMVEAGLIDMYECNSVLLYSLTANEERRRLVLELTSLGWNWWRIALGRVWAHKEQRRSYERRFSEV